MRAKTLLEIAIKKEPNNVNALYYLAFLLVKGEGIQKDTKRASSLLDRAVQLSPRDSRILSLRQEMRKKLLGVDITRVWNFFTKNSMH